MNKVLKHGWASAALALAMGICLAGCATVAPLDNVVILSSGTVSGNPRDASGIVSFKGIPYAAPPVGKLRWKEPQPVQPWAGTRDATKFGPHCWTSSAFDGQVQNGNAGEDCLSVNVWSGAKGRSDKLPVMVWIYGGGFQFGASSDPVSDGSKLAGKGVVVVSFNYRLGVFGFLSRPDLDAESNGHQSGMYGLHDQVAALKWVKANVNAFGGDPNNITIFGESAGAHSVGFLLASPLTEGLFNKAIASSGAFWQSKMKTYANAQVAGMELSTKMNAPTLEALRAIPADQLQKSTNWTFAVPQSFAPTIDGYFMPEPPYVRFMKGLQRNVPLLVGWNADEAIPFVNYRFPFNTVQAFTDAASKIFGSENLNDFLKVYPADTAAQAAVSSMAELGDITIKYQVWGMANQHQKTSHSPVYIYNFGFRSPFTPIPTHVTDVGYVFGTLTPTPFNKGKAAAEDVAMSEKMQTYWTNFARTGTPNGNGLPQWPQYYGSGSQALHLGNVIEAGQEEGTARFLFLDKFRINGVFTPPQQ